MSNGPHPSRALPGRPSLRYLKLEAKRRLGAGEFPALHDAQAAIAREHGLPNWAALKQQIRDQEEQRSDALRQLRWVIGRFAPAGQPSWVAPGEEELRGHFDDNFLAALPPAELVRQIAAAADDLREELVVVGHRPLAARARLGHREIRVVVEPRPPHRITGLNTTVAASGITDARLAEPPPARTEGDVPAGMAELASQARAELGVAALAVAGGDPGAQPWVVTAGWPDLDRAEPLEPRHRFPAPGLAALVTAVAVLRLVADAKVGLGTRASEFLRALRLADETITVRELLSHTAGVSNPAPLYAQAVPDMVALLGPVAACDGPRGELWPSNGGYAVLGQLVADVTGVPFAQAAADLVLTPLGMRDSSFPASMDSLGPDVVTGYTVTGEGVFMPVRDRICTIQAAGGLWATPADLVRLGTGWSSLLPPALAREAVTVQTPPGPGFSAGLSWLISPGEDTAMQGGTAADSAATLTIRVRDNRAHITVTNRQAAIGQVDEQVLSSWTNAA